MTIEVETGPMFSGKTSELLTQIQNLVIAGDIQDIDFIAFNHATDKRYGENVIASHGKNSVPAIPASSSKDIFDSIFNVDDQNNISLKENRELLASVFIDEAQFFDMELGKVIQFADDYYLYNLGQSLKFYVAGLDMDFKGEPFGPMPDIMARAEKVNKFTAVCKKCKKRTPREAKYTQRLIDGRPAKYNDPIIMVGASESYTARCKKHHEVPEKPTPKIRN